MAQKVFGKLIGRTTADEYRIGQFSKKKADKAKRRKRQARRNERKQSNRPAPPNNGNGRPDRQRDYNARTNYNQRNRELLSDRELLAAAKDRFSRPPTSYRPTIQFKRGEILNPYPSNEAHQRPVAIPRTGWHQELHQLQPAKHAVHAAIRVFNGTDGTFEG